MFGKKKTKKKKIKVSRMKIVQHKGNYIDVYDTNYKNLLDPWRGFYKWWYCKKSESYLFTYRDGCITVRRSNIAYFKTEIEEVYE